MSHTRDCLQQYFNDGSQTGYNLVAIKPATAHITGLTYTLQRPFIPLYAVKESTNTLLVLAQYANFATFIRGMYASSLQASVNWVENNILVVYPEKYLSGEYGNYLNSLITGKPENLLRYNSIKDILSNYYATLAAQQTPQDVINLFHDIQPLIDKRYMIAPGEYDFTLAAAIAIPYNAMRIAIGENPIIYGIELQSIQ